MFHAKSHTVPQTKAKKLRKKNSQEIILTLNGSLNFERDAWWLLDPPQKPISTEQNTKEAQRNWKKKSNFLALKKIIVAKRNFIYFAFNYSLLATHTHKHTRNTFDVMSFSIPIYLVPMASFPLPSLLLLLSDQTRRGRKHKLKLGNCCFQSPRP